MYLITVSWSASCTRVGLGPRIRPTLAGGLGHGKAFWLRRPNILPRGLSEHHRAGGMYERILGNSSENVRGPPCVLR